MDQARELVPQEDLRKGTTQLVPSPPPCTCPSPKVDRPSDSTLHSHRISYEQALTGGSEQSLAKWRKTYGETLRLHGMNAEAHRIDPPRSSSNRGNSQQTVPMEVDRRGSGARASATDSRPAQPRSQPSSSRQPTPQLPSTRRSNQRSEQVEKVHDQGGGDALSSQDDSGSWESQMLAEEQRPRGGSQAGWTGVRHKNQKRTRESSTERQQQSRLRKETRSPQPFSLRRYEERVAATLKVYEVAGQQTEAICD